jgi:hypothetical protein
MNDTRTAPGTVVAFDAFLTGVWRWRTELALLAWLVVPCVVLGKKAGPVAGIAVALVAVASLVLVPRLRRSVAHLLFVAHHRRRFEVAVSHLTDRILCERPPVVRTVERIPAGVRLSVVMGPGTHVGDLERVAPALASSMRARDLRIVRDAGDASLVRLSVHSVDPLATQALSWPGSGLDRTDAWSPVPVGVDEDGSVVLLTLAEHNVLLGGETGSGKSGALAVMTATAALDPNTILWLLDAKLVELAAWRGCARRFCGPDMEDAIGVLSELRDDMTARYELLASMGKRKLERADGHPMHVVVIDELVRYVCHPDKKLAALFTETLRDLVARGRAAGIVVLAATQKPSVDMVPSALRDLFGYRWAMRCATRDASDTVLGAGWAANGFSAADIDPATRGVGLLLHEGGVPVRLRGYWLDDDAIGDIAERAQALRRKEPPGTIRDAS